MWKRLDRQLQRFDRRHTQRDLFLQAYEQEQSIAGAARRAGINRSTIYRWLERKTITKEQLTAAWHRGHDRWRKEVYEPQEALRQQRRQQRNAELLEKRREQAAYAREALRQKRQKRGKTW